MAEGMQSTEMCGPCTCCGKAVEDDVGFGVPVVPGCLVGWMCGWGVWDGGTWAEGFVAYSGAEVV